MWISHYHTSPPSGAPSSSPSRPSQSARLGSCAYCTATSHQRSILHLMVLHVDAAFSIHLTLLPLLCQSYDLTWEKTAGRFHLSESIKTQILAIKYKRYLNFTSHSDALEMAATGSLNNYKTAKKMLKTIVNKQYIEEFFFFFFFWPRHAACWILGPRNGICDLIRSNACPLNGNSES